MSIGAPPLSLSFDGREYQTVGDGAGTPEQGGLDNEWAPNGDPTSGRVIQTPTGWRYNDQGIDIDLSTDDWEYLNDKKNNGVIMDIVITWADAVYGGRGVIEGKFTLDKMASTASVTLAGPGQLQKL